MRLFGLSWNYSNEGVKQSVVRISGWIPKAGLYLNLQVL
jgi:hypothetical protein